MKPSRIVYRNKYYTMSKFEFDELDYEIRRTMRWLKWRDKLAARLREQPKEPNSQSEQ